MRISLYFRQNRLDFIYKGALLGGKENEVVKILDKLFGRNKKGSS